jgi:plastocyanin
MTQFRFIFPLLTTLAVAACGGSSGGYGGISGPGPVPDSKTITASSALAFGPASLTVNAGDVVTFAFGTIAHNVFFDAQTGAPADISGSNANVSVTRTFTTPGTYRYTCHIHPFMVGTVVVQ